MTKNELINFLNEQYPFNQQEEWDACGPHTTKFCNEKIKGIYVSLDMNFKTLRNAIKNQCNVIITHHPILSNNENANLEKTNKLLVKTLNQKHILNISLHTCFDQHPQGTSWLIYQLLSQTLKLTIPKQLNNPYLVFGKLSQKITIKAIVEKIKKLNSSFIPNISFLNDQANNVVKHICVGAGSCCSMINDILDKKIDLFITGDIKWHNYLDAHNNNLNLIDIGHCAERVFISFITSIILKKNDSLKIIEDNDYLNIIHIN